MLRAVNWIRKKLWQWEVAGTGATTSCGIGVAAMYEGQFIVAACLYFLSVIWLTAKTITWEETKSHEQRKGISILILVMGMGFFAGSLLWIRERYEHELEMLGQPTTGLVTATAKDSRILLGLLSGPWFQRAAYFGAGILFLGFLLLIPRIWISIRSERATVSALTDAQKGVLDYKLQAEESIEQMGSLLSEITRIVEQIGPSMQAHALRVEAVKSLPARLQIQRVGEAARDLDRYSAKLDTKCAKLEEAGNSFIEGVSGWVVWFSKQKNIDPPNQMAATQMATILTQLANQTSTTLVHFDSYLKAVESIRGTSQDMNAAVDAHLSSFGRVRAVTDKIRTSCLLNVKLIMQFADGHNSAATS
jgi:hypothetical protein